MTDREPLDRLEKYAGGKIYGPYQYGPKRKLKYNWTLSRPNGARELAALIRPYMSPRRQEQIDKLLTPTPKKEWAHGTVSAYNYRKCRCDLCREAGNKYQRDRYKRL